MNSYGNAPCLVSLGLIIGAEVVLRRLNFIHMTVARYADGNCHRWQAILEGVQYRDWGVSIK